MRAVGTAHGRTAVIVVTLIIGIGIGAGALAVAQSQSSPVGAVGPPPGTPANPEPAHLRLKGTSTVSPGWSESFWVALAPACPAGYHSAGGTIGSFFPADLAIAANAFVKNEATGIETQGFWLNSISGSPIAPGAVFTVYVECVSGSMPA
jgi:hypothetical protein